MAGIYTSDGLRNMTEHRECVYFDRANLDYLAYAICNRLNGDPKPLIWQYSFLLYCKRILQAFGMEMGGPTISDNGNYEFCVTWGEKISEKWKDPYYLREMLSTLYVSYDEMVKAASVGSYNADMLYVIGGRPTREAQIKDIVDILRNLGFSVNLEKIQDMGYGYATQIMHVKW